MLVVAGIAREKERRELRHRSLAQRMREACEAFAADSVELEGEVTQSKEGRSRLGRCWPNCRSERAETLVRDGVVGERERAQ